MNDKIKVIRESAPVKEVVVTFTFSEFVQTLHAVCQSCQPESPTRKLWNRFADEVDGS